MSDKMTREEQIMMNQMMVLGFQMIVRDAIAHYQGAILTSIPRYDLISKNEIHDARRKQFNNCAHKIRAKRTQGTARNFAQAARRHGEDQRMHIVPIQTVRRMLRNVANTGLAYRR